MPFKKGPRVAPKRILRAQQVQKLFILSAPARTVQRRAAKVVADVHAQTTVVGQELHHFRAAAAAGHVQHRLPEAVARVHAAPLALELAQSLEFRGPHGAHDLHVVRRDLKKNKQ